MAPTKQEKRLLRQQAEAYAFIQDVRQTARLLGTGWVLRRTEGIEQTIKKRREEYPRVFQRYFNQALERAQKEVQQKKPSGVVRIDDGAEAVPRREKKAQKKKKAKDVAQRDSHKRTSLE